MRNTVIASISGGGGGSRKSLLIGRFDSPEDSKCSNGVPCADFNVQQVGHPEEQTVRHSERSEESKKIDSSVTAFPQNDIHVIARSISDEAIQDNLARRVMDCFAFARNDVVKKCAFTLAEVLITLGIIGVVAAMTIPTLITNYQKHQTATRLKKVYAELHQALKLSIAENDDFEGWDFYDEDSKENSAEFFEKYFAKHMKVTRKDDTCAGVNSTSATVCYVTLNGTAIKFQVLTSKLVNIQVDLNGKELPNKMGRDIFELGITEKRGLYLFGSPTATRSQLINGTPINNGTDMSCCSNTCAKDWASKYNCGRLIQLDGWKISPDYPWK